MALLPRLIVGSTRLSPHVRAMLWMAASGLVFTVLNTIMKALAEDLHPWVVGSLRYLLGFVVFLPMVMRLGAASLRSAAPGLQSLRGLFHVLGLLLWFAALPMISMTEMTAISFTGPIFICVGAVLILKEQMTAPRWIAVLIGFAGVMIVVHPWDGGFGAISWGIVLMFLSTPAFSASLLVAKLLIRYDRVDLIVLWQHGMVALFSLPFALWYWTPPSLEQWLWLILCGMLGAGGHYCLTRSYRGADISALQSVRFLDLVWAALAGLIVFSVLPEFWTVVGGVIICSATVWLARREARANRRLAATAAPATSPSVGKPA